MLLTLSWHQCGPGCSRRQRRPVPLRIGNQQDQQSSRAVQPVGHLSSHAGVIDGVSRRLVGRAAHSSEPMVFARPAGKGFSPLAEELGLTSASLTPPVLAGLVRLSTWLPFRRAAELLAALIGVQVSEATARRWTETGGAAVCAVGSKQADVIRRELPPVPLGAARLLLNADGAFVPLLHGEWAEAKLLVMGEVTTDPAGQPQTTTRSYFAPVAEAETFEGGGAGSNAPARARARPSRVRCHRGGRVVARPGG